MRIIAIILSQILSLEFELMTGPKLRIRTAAPLSLLGSAFEAALKCLLEKKKIGGGGDILVADTGGESASS